MQPKYKIKTENAGGQILSVDRKQGSSVQKALTDLYKCSVLSRSFALDASIYKARVHVLYKLHLDIFEDL